MVFGGFFILVYVMFQHQLRVLQLESCTVHAYVETNSIIPWPVGDMSGAG